MAVYRNGTYIAFHAQGITNPTESDIRYYNLLKSWHVRRDNQFFFVNSHHKTRSIRDSSLKETLRRALVYRLRRSKNMILIMTESTRHDTDWVPFEIQYAIDICEIPIIVAYPGYNYITNPYQLSWMWPAVLKERITGDCVRTIHIPFRQTPLIHAVKLGVNNPPNWTVTWYSIQAYRKWCLAPTFNFWPNG